MTTPYACGNETCNIPAYSLASSRIFTVLAGNFKSRLHVLGIFYYLLIKYEQADGEQKGEGSEGK